MLNAVKEIVGSEFNLIGLQVLLNILVVRPRILFLVIMHERVLRQVLLLGRTIFWRFEVDWLRFLPKHH